MVKSRPVVQKWGLGAGAGGVAGMPAEIISGSLWGAGLRTKGLDLLLPRISALPVGECPLKDHRIHQREEIGFLQGPVGASWGIWSSECQGSL